MELFGFQLKWKEQKFLLFPILCILLFIYYRGTFSSNQGDSGCDECTHVKSFVWSHRAKGTVQTFIAKKYLFDIELDGSYHFTKQFLEEGIYQFDVDVSLLPQPASSPMGTDSPRYVIAHPSLVTKEYITGLRPLLDFLSQINTFMRNLYENKGFKEEDERGGKQLQRHGRRRPKTRAIVTLEPKFDLTMLSSFLLDVLCDGNDYQFLRMFIIVKDDEGLAMMKDFLMSLTTGPDEVGNEKQKRNYCRKNANLGVAFAYRSMNVEKSFLRWEDNQKHFDELISIGLERELILSMPDKRLVGIDASIAMNEKTIFPPYCGSENTMKSGMRGDVIPWVIDDDKELLAHLPSVEGIITNYPLGYHQMLRRKYPHCF